MAKDNNSVSKKQQRQELLVSLNAFVESYNKYVEENKCYPNIHTEIDAIIEKLKYLINNDIGWEGCFMSKHSLFGKEVDVLVIMWFSYVFIINKYLSSTLIRKLSRGGRS